MRPKESIGLQGYFWLPDNLQHKIPGTLKVSDSGKVALDVLGTFRELPEFEPRPAPIIHGVTENGKSATLFDCFTYSTQLRFPGIPKASATAAYLFLGAHLHETDPLEFARVIFSVEGLNQWLGLTGISVSHEWDAHELKQAAITFRPPPAQAYKLGGALDLSIKFRSTIPFGYGSITEARVAQEAFLEIEAAKPTAFHDLLRVVHRVNTFLCLAIDEAVALTGVGVSSPTISETIGENTRPVGLQVYFPSLPHSEKAPAVDSHRLLFPYAAVAANLGDLISAWLADYEVLEPAINLYFASTTARHAYVETRFLFLVQGLETFHRRTSDKTVMPDSEFQDVKRTVLSMCPQSHTEWLKTRLTYANELSLRQRLRALIDPISHYFGDSSRVGALIHEVVTTRNYLTHYDKSSKQAALSGEALSEVSMKLEAMFTLLFLRRFGFTTDQLDQVAGGNYRVAQKLKGEI
ncbi:MAG: hypothetical protein M3495_18775 [Pseudomonadota bacterium]|nr:hypothetical protein [Gammaproteobacteria bacterium]MDQ3583514.1 hypothetical protein [Pseudomonadota bacterium]